MKKSTRVICLISIILNFLVVLAAVSFLHNRGGIIYVENRISSILSSEPAIIPIVKIRNENLKLVGVKEKDVVFVGDSHTNYFEWGEYFSVISVANRGIGSDTTKGILGRIDGIVALNPKKIFIMAGINDIQKGIPIEDIEQNYVKIIEYINKSNPNVEIYVQSVLPVAGKLYERNFYKSSKPLNEAVIQLNKKLSELEGVTYINIADNFGKELPDKYSVDGVHLNKDGYKVWVDTITDDVTQ